MLATPTGILAVSIWNVSAVIFGDDCPRNVDNTECRGSSDFLLEFIIAFEVRPVDFAFVRFETPARFSTVPRPTIAKDSGLCVIVVTHHAGYGRCAQKTGEVIRTAEYSVSGHFAQFICSANCQRKKMVNRDDADY